MRSRHVLARVGLAASLALALAAGGCGSGGGGGGAGGVPGQSGQRVAYVSDADTLGVLELFVSDVGGGDAGKASGATVPLADVGYFAWSPDRTKIAFLADRDVDDRLDLYVADLAPGGADPPNVSAVGPDAPWGSVQDFVWSPDGEAIAFAALVAADTSALFVVDLSAPVVEPVLVSPVPPAGAHVKDFDWSPLGDRVAYRADVLVKNRMQVFSVEPDGGGHTLLSVADPGVTTDGATMFAWSPDGSRVAFLHNPQGASARRLYTCLPGGGDVVERSAITLPNTAVDLFRWSPDGSKIAYVADQAVDEVTELFVTHPLAGSPDEVGSATGTFDVDSVFTWSPDSTRLAYALYDPATGSGDLRVVSASGGAPVVVAGPYGPGERPVWPTWSPVGDRFAFLGFHGTFWDLGVAEADGSGEHVAGPAGDDQFAGTGVWSPDGERIAYRRVDFVSDVDTRTNAFVVDADGGAPTPLSDVPDSQDDVAGSSRPEWAPDSQRLVFLAGDPDGTGAAPPRRLWVATLGLGGPSVVDLTPDPTGLAQVTRFELE